MKLTRQDYILAGGQALLWITLWLIPPAIDFSYALIRVRLSRCGRLIRGSLLRWLLFSPLISMYWFPICFIGIGRCSLVDEFAIDHGG